MSTDVEKLILERLTELNTKIEALMKESNREISELKSRMAVIETKAGIYGLLAGMIGVLLTFGIKYLL